MRYRRALLVTELGADPAPAFAAVALLAPRAETLLVAAVAPRGGVQPAPEAVEQLRAAAAHCATRVEVRTLPAADAGALGALVAEGNLELAIASPQPAGALGALGEVRDRLAVAVAWVGAVAAPAGQPRGRLACVALGSRAETALGAFLRDHGEAGQVVTLFRLARPSPEELALALGVAGIRATVEVVALPDARPWGSFQGLVKGEAVDLVVLPRFPVSLLAQAPWPAPVLVLPPLPPMERALQRPLDVPDLVDDGGPLRVRLGLALGLGRRPPIEDQEVAFVAGGRVVAQLQSRGGELELPAGLKAESLGVFRVGPKPPPEPVAAVERQVAVLRPGPRPLVLFDADLGEPALAELAALARGRGLDALAVRLVRDQACHLSRERLKEAGLPPRVIDAGCVLGEGDAEDIDEVFGPVRLARVGARLRGAGFPVVLAVHGGEVDPRPRGFAAARPGALGQVALDLAPPGPPPRTLAERLDALVGAPRLEGHRVELELDNAAARQRLLEALAGARSRIHLQLYMGTDDAVGRQVEAALAEAAARGVVVRVLVDSLHALHGSYGARNPLFDRLAARPGVELRAWRPVSGLPSVVDLKRRDHRKLLVVDGQRALVGGRNLAQEYYTGFEEVALGPRTSWREVPWLDGGGAVEGPVVAELERAFLEAWQEAGGAPFELPRPAAAGATPARLVVHRGLEDAATLETYLAIIETARSHLYAVNGFPLLLELQQALVRAIHRGVRVRTLFGHVTPIHGGEPFEGAWSSARTVATWLVHSRMDALVAAGAEAYQLAVPSPPGWAPDLGQVLPHVHAKVLSADGAVCTIGSANLDVTASYWESELLLVFEDPAVAGALEARLEALLAGSVRVEREDPAWQRLARQRELLKHWPSLLSV